MVINLAKAERCITCIFEGLVQRLLVDVVFVFLQVARVLVDGVRGGVQDGLVHRAGRVLCR